MAHEALVRIAGSGEWRLHDARVGFVRYPQLHQAVEVVEHVWVAEHRGTPVGVDAPLELGVGFGDLVLEILDVGGVDGRVARVLHVDAVVGEGAQVGRVLGLARRCEAFKLVEDVLSRVRYHPVAVHSVSDHGGREKSKPGIAHRISASFSSMARCSACLTAICSRSDSQGHSGYAGALQMAQFGAASISACSHESVAAGIITEHVSPWLGGGGGWRCASGGRPGASAMLRQPRGGDRGHDA